MEFYLQECKHNLKNASESSKIQVVLGNESCDLDSAISSLVMAYFIFKVQKTADIIIPVLNVKRKELAVRTEVVFFLEETSINISDVICIDEIDLKALHEKGKLSVVLVDHNALSTEQLYLDSRIVQIIDHHEINNPDKIKKLNSKIELVGSCCTLVAEEILNSNVSIMDPQIAMLLYGTIVLDTICLNETAQRVTEKDKKIVDKLETYLDGIKLKFDQSDKSELDNSFNNCENKISKNTDVVDNYEVEEFSDDIIPTYQAEPVDFPDSPDHSRLLEISIQSPGLVNLIPESDDLEIRKDVMVPEGTGTLKRIAVNPKVLESQFIEDDQRSLSSLSNRSDAFSQSEDIILDDDAATIEDLDDNSDCDSDLDSPLSDPIPEMSAAEEFEEERSWKSCTVNGEDRKIDMKVIEPYRKVLSHGGYQGDGNAIIIFSACYLPDRSRKDYEYVMDNLFLYVIVTLDELVAEDYVLIYLHGATERSNMPSFGWLKRCYQMIDRRLRKNLKRLYLVHPTFWLKTIVIMTRPFISSKFTRKLKFVYSLKELSNLVFLDYVCIPDKVKQFDEDMFPD
ncbi:protein prune homolog 2 [Nephila pilipes]|uniref:Protein prune homolog 2 n=1 Tax=Nephila pilipes TaxID=299642 RepID=A0A8X6QMM8_NEPPI|nr:protein prune homolog 2 [Nephila pilipes]